MTGTAPSFIEMELRSNDTRRHWSPSSQQYAPADVFVSYLADGWLFSPVVGLEEHFHAGIRRVDVYHFELTKEGQSQVLPVQSNPIVRRLLHQYQLRVVLLKRDAVPMQDEKIAQA